MSSKKVYINLANKYDRIVVLIDMDCFYCQVEEKLNPELAGKPIAVVQYNTWQGGGIIAVNYPARAKGVTRHMRGDEAKEQCPEIELVRVPSVRDKADLTKYREAGKEVAIVLQSFTSILERASIDEAYLDITESVLKRAEEMKKGQFQLKPSELISTYVVGYNNVGDYIQEISSRVDHDDCDYDFDYNEDDLPAIQKSDLNLLIGASIVNEIRVKVKEITGYECSAGIAHNKILAKLACGINKPNKQTILPLRQIGPLFDTLPVGKVKGLGGKFGEDVCETLKIKFIGDLQQFSENELQRKFDEKSGSWLYLIARGIDLEAVTPRFYSKSIGCCKKFPGKNCITGLNTLIHWLTELSKEICDRMSKDEIENNRKAKQMVVSYIQEINGVDVSSSRSTNLLSNEPEQMAKYALEIIKKNTDQFYKMVNNENVINNPIKFLGISIGKFESIETKKQSTLQQMFMNQSKRNLESTKEKIENDGTGSSSTSSKEIKENEEIVKENDNELESKKVQEDKSIKRSFFAAHLKKKDVSKEIQKVDSNENEKNKKEIKSFFLNAIKSNKNEQIAKSKVDQALVDNNGQSIPQKSPKSNSMNSEKFNLNDETSNHQNNNDPVPGTSKQFYENNNDEDITLETTTTTTNEEDYIQQYVEYAIPEPSENDYMDCEKCGKRILSYTLQTHMDYHYAFELSREQRETYRQEILSKIKSSSSILSPPTKKLKTNKTQNKIPIKNNLIDKFLVRKDDLASNRTSNSINLNNSSSSTDDEVTELCEECKLQIPITKLLEHHDYHTAKKLQIEMNRSILTTSLSSSSSLVPSSSSQSIVNNDTINDNLNENKSISTKYFSAQT